MVTPRKSRSLGGCYIVYKRFYKIGAAFALFLILIVSFNTRKPLELSAFTTTFEKTSKSKALDFFDNQGDDYENTDDALSIANEGEIDAVVSPTTTSIEGNIGTSKDQLFRCTEEEIITDRWSHRPFSKSHIESLFNCHLDNSLCKYYYPSNFFESSCGLGKKFSHYISDIETKRLNGTLWNFMPEIGFPTLTLKGTCLDSNGNHYIHPPGAATPSSASLRMTLQNIGPHEIEVGNGEKIRCITERLSMLHVHKSGGSSLHESFRFMARGKSSALDRHKFYSPPRTFAPKPPPTEDDQIRKITKRALEHATKYPEEEYAPEQHIIFAVVRDPLERFISSIGQAMGAKGSGGNHIAPILQKECIKLTSRETLTCVARYVKEHTFWIELHFTPQALDISFTTLYYDVPVGVFSFEHIGTVLDYFGKGNIKSRDGHKGNYRAHQVLRNMTVDDYEEESLRVVCEIYEMDVLMQRSLGLQVPRCDPYIPNTHKFE